MIGVLIFVVCVAFLIAFLTRKANEKVEAARKAEYKTASRGDESHKENGIEGGVENRQSLTGVENFGAKPTG